MRERKEKGQNLISSLKDIIDLSRSFWKSKILLVANELDVFSKLSDSPKTAKDLSEIMKTDPRATELLLNAVAGMGLLKKKKGIFSNTEVSKRYLCQSSASYIGFALRHYNYCWDAWSELDQVIKRGHPSRFIEQEALRNDEKRARDFALMMDYFGRKTVVEIDKFLSLGRVKKMLDLGGGSGCYSIFFAKKYSQLESVVFDLPLVAKFAKENVAEGDLTNRIRVVEGDFLTDEIGESYDLVFISFVLHTYNSSEISLIFRKVHRALQEEGRIVILEYILEENDTRPIEAAIFSILMLVNTMTGKVHNFKEIKDTLNKNRFEIVKIQKLTKPDVLKSRNPFLIIAKKGR